MARQGVDVIGIDNERSGDWSRVDVNIDRVERDICQMSEWDWKDLCQGVDVAFHLAVEKHNSSRTTPERVVATNISATQCLLVGAAAAGARKTVFTSSLYAYGSMGPADLEASVGASAWNLS